MHASTRIRDIIDAAKSPAERQALRFSLLQLAAEIGSPPTKPQRTEACRSRWPRIGGSDLVVAPDLTVETDEYQRRWRASDLLLWVYAVGCPGLQDLGKRLSLPLFKVGTTEGSIQHRLAELGRDGYGAAWRDGNRLVTEPGFGRGAWVAEQIPVDIDLSPLSPIHPSIRGIGVRLPVGLDALAFERALSVEVGKASLGKFVASPGGRTLCADRGVDPARCRRMTRYVFGSDVRPSDEEEFTVFRPRADANRLAAVAERIVVRHVMGQGR